MVLAVVVLAVVVLAVVVLAAVELVMSGAAVSDVRSSPPVHAEISRQPAAAATVRRTGVTP